MKVDSIMGKTPKIGCIVATLSFSAFLIVIFYEFLSHHDVEGKLGPVKAGCLASLLLLLGCVASDFTWRIASDFYSFKNLWIHYLSLMCIRLMSTIFYNKLMKTTNKVERVQQETLLKLIKNSTCTKYGRDHGFQKIHSVSEFRRTHPLTFYNHYKDYIDRIYNGEANVMSKAEPCVLAMTSGTSGQPKMLPMQKQQRTIFFLYGILPLFHIMFEYMKGIRNLQKKLKFFYTPRWRRAPSNILIGPNSSSPTNSQAEISFHSTPPAAFDILSEPEALYVYLLFGLRDRKLGYLEANFASMIFTAFVMLEKNWKRLVNDIRKGSIDNQLSIDLSIRKKLNAELSPDPTRANELESEFERGFLGIAKKIWPHMNFILCVDSGAFQVYGELLKSTYCKGIEIYSPIYAATEGLIGINLWPTSEERHYMLVPTSLFYEFIPIDASTSDNPQTLLLHELSEGETYEMVISNASGLYRYRFGDVVRAVRFINQLPVVEFMYRQGQLLNVRGEKTSEKLFYASFENAFHSVLSCNQIMDYCCCEKLANTADVSPSYLVFVEVYGDQPSTEKIEQLGAQLDDNLKQSYIYKSFRDKGSIAQPSVFLLKPGTFTQFRMYMIESEKATPNQFKVPRVIKKPELIEFLSKCTVTCES